MALEVGRRRKDDLVDYLPAKQGRQLAQTMHRVLGCQPQAARFVAQEAR
jgi:hypothetical protein